MTRVLRPGVLQAFPEPDPSDPAGLVAVGGDLSVRRLLQAYDGGVFPCYGDDTPILWWSPDPRAVLLPDRLHVSRRLAQTLRQRRFTLSFDRAFRAVMEACDEHRDGSWILPEMVDAYERLHEEGHAHSLEVWRDGELVGGVYGVHRGALFAAESMFHRETDMSKVALVALVRSLARCGIELFDVQHETPHLASLGAIEWPRARYIAELRRLVPKSVRLKSPPLSP